MASVQVGVRKKQARSPVALEHKPVLYRHQDCIPDAKLFENCEKTNFSDIKNNTDQVNQKQQKKCAKTSDQTKTIRGESLTKSGPKTNKNPEEAKSKSDQTTETSEEVSKSRKRRLRKQRLLTSLAPPLANSNPTTTSGGGQATLSGTLIQTKSVVSPDKSVKTSSDLGVKPNVKDSRKRLDKSVSLRSKTIKSKPLVDQSISSKAGLIKTLEEKTLNSLLQTLAPLANSSTKKPSPPLPLFSFPEKKLNTSASGNKIDKDGVFYFGETKDQLEKFASSTSESSGSNQLSKQPLLSQNTKSSKSFIPIINTESCVPSSSFSKETRHEGLSFNQFSDVHKTNSLSNSKAVATNFYTQEYNPTLQVSPGISTKKNLNSEVKLGNGVQFASTAGSTNTSSELSIVKSSLIDKIDFSIQNTNNTILNSTQLTEPLSTSSDRNSVKNIENNQDKMKPMEENHKSNKTREEIKIEREAKKAAKLAAKTKSKSSETKKIDNVISDGCQMEGSSVSQNKTHEKDTKPGKEKLLSLEKSSRDSVTPIIKPDQESTTSNNNTLTLSKQTTEDSSVKSKSELKAERRAKQEAQRAAKAAGKTAEPQKKENIVLSAKNVAPIKSEIEKKSEIPSAPVVKITTQPKLKLFSHLYKENTPSLSNQILPNRSLHPAVVRLGVQYSRRVVVGSNARCVALLHALKQMVNDYTTPSEKEFSRGLEEELGPVTVYLNQCRPLAVSMTNALRHIKRTLTQLPNNISDLEARRKICDVIDTYIHEQIDVAGKAICNRVLEKIADGDVILTYGCSSLVYQILVESHEQGTKFKVVVVDGLPWREGKEMLRRLVDKGLSCTYVLITAASFIMREASKVLLGAHALLANGYVMSRAGSSQVALLAHCNNVPVLVCCETHKFCERVQTDAFVYNELGDLSCDDIKEKGKFTDRLTPVSLAYDITPPDLVSAVVTEVAVLPCTSVPVILRIKPSESVM